MTPQTRTPQEGKSISLRVGLVGLALLTLAMFFETLIAPGSRVLGTPSTDLATQFLPWRDFGFGELAKGNLALWNPHIFAGAPFFGGMQSALLYPLNWVYLVLPLPLAVNWTIALSVWLLGAFMYLWALRRGLHPFAAFVSAALAMFCAPSFLHVHAGHLAHLSAMPWVPLLFLAIDAWLDSRRPVWCLIGMLAVAMQIFAGHPQYVYITAIAAGIYSLARLAEPRRARIAAATGLLILAAGGALLAAVQLLAGVQATAETVRAQPLPFEFATSFSYPPENLLTLIAPGFFGGLAGHPYWGRWYLWEACGFIGVGGLALAAYGLAVGRMPGKRALVATAAIAALLALGGNTPIFRVLYDWAPLFDRFRGAGKFMFVGALLLTLFAGYGMDRILRERVVPTRALWVAGATVLALLAGSAVVRVTDWGVVMRTVFETGQTYLGAASYANGAFVMASSYFTSFGLVLAALTLAVFVVFGFWTRRDSRAALLIGAFAVVEVFAFARALRPTFDSTQIVIPQLRAYLAGHPGDYRILDLTIPNAAISMRAFDAWGYDPGVTRRYAEFIEWSEGRDPDMATQYVSFNRFHPLLAMLRVKYVITLMDGVMRIIPAAIPPLGRLELVGAFQVREGRDAILRAMGDASFDPRMQVILERQPNPLPLQGQARGRATILREGTDFLEIEADVTVPSVLLVTDAWAAGWRATALDGGSQSRYELVPANYTLRAVALGAGKHRMRLEYAPLSFRVGAALSVIAWLAWILAVFLVKRRGREVARA